MVNFPHGIGAGVVGCQCPACDETRLNAAHRAMRNAQRVGTLLFVVVLVAGAWACVLYVHRFNQEMKLYSRPEARK